MTTAHERRDAYYALTRNPRSSLVSLALARLAWDAAAAREQVERLRDRTYRRTETL